MTTKPLQVKRTDWYEIIPLPDGLYLFLIEDIVVGSGRFSTINEAEDYMLYHYEELRYQPAFTSS